MWNDYSDVVQALQDLISVNTVNFERIFSLGVIVVVLIAFNIFRRKEHI